MSVHRRLRDIEDELWGGEEETAPEQIVVIHVPDNGRGLPGDDQPCGTDYGATRIVIDPPGKHAGPD